MICWCIIPTLTNSKFGANETINFVCFYSLAGYARLYPDDFGTRKYILLGIAFINTLASATFGVYLIHDSGLVRPFLWHEVFRNASFQDSPYLIPYSIAVTLIVYIACTILELLRSRIFKALSRGRLS